MQFRFLILSLVTFVLCAPIALAETPTEAVDRVWTAFAYDPNQRNYQLSPSFIELSKQVAHDQGIAVIAPIMTRSNDWKGEEQMAFATLVESLPPDEAKLILEQYKTTGTTAEKHYATIFDDLIILRESAQKKMADLKKEKAQQSSAP